MNYFEDGVLSSAFMVGLLVASPIFASLAKRLVFEIFDTELHWYLIMLSFQPILKYVYVATFYTTSLTYVILLENEEHVAQKRLALLHHINFSVMFLMQLRMGYKMLLKER